MTLNNLSIPPSIDNYNTQPTNYQTSCLEDKMEASNKQQSMTAETTSTGHSRLKDLLEIADDLLLFSSPNAKLGAGVLATLKHDYDANLGEVHGNKENDPDMKYKQQQSSTNDVASVIKTSVNQHCASPSMSLRKRTKGESAKERWERMYEISGVKNEEGVVVEVGGKGGEPTVAKDNNEEDQKKTKVARPKKKQKIEGPSEDLPLVKPKKTAARKSKQSDLLQHLDSEDKERVAAAIRKINDKYETQSAVHHLPGVTMRPSGKWVSCVCMLMLACSHRYSTLLVLRPLLHISAPRLPTASSTILCREITIHWSIRHTRRSSTSLRNSTCHSHRGEVCSQTTRGGCGEEC